MIGWRGRIGLIIPATNTVMESDFNKYLPSGVSAFASRMKRNSDISSLETNINMLNYAEEAASLLTWAEVDINIFGCTAASFLRGIEENISLSEKLQQKTGVHTVTASTAIINALNSLNAKKVFLITPYVDEITLKEVDFLSKCGFNVKGYSGMGIKETKEMGKIAPEGIYRFTKERIVKKIEAVVISCTTLRSMEVIELIEKDLQIPVVTSNQACLWYALQFLGINEVNHFVGELFYKKNKEWSIEKYYDKK